MSPGALVLVIDDEREIRRLLRFNLEAAGYQVHDAASGEEGLVQAAALRPDVVILDLGLPDMEGLAVLRQLREWCRAPVVVLSVRDTDADKVAMLDAGADDYLTKPYSTSELLARMRAALRHAQPTPDQPVFSSAGLAVDLSRRLVTLHGQVVKLSVTEYSVLRLLVQHAGRVVLQRQLLREVWGPQYDKETHYLRIYLGQLRRKLEADPANPVLLLTEPGIGYRLEVLPTA